MASFFSAICEFYFFKMNEKKNIKNLNVEKIQSNKIPKKKNVKKKLSYTILS